MKAVEIMSTPAVSVTPRTSVRRAANILSERGFSALPVALFSSWLRLDRMLRCPRCTRLCPVVGGAPRNEAASV